MTDVFVSYASEDRERVRKLASALETHGWSVWWDRKIIAGQTFDQIIEHELETAKSVVVLWSKVSISSEWVKNEATVASERGVLVPALIDRVKPPLEFRRKQTADLVGWDGDPSHGGFQALCDGVAAKTNILGVAPHQSTTRPVLRSRWNLRWTLSAIAVVAVVMGFIAYRVLIVTPQQDWFSGRNDTQAQRALPESPDSDNQPNTSVTFHVADTPGAPRVVAHTPANGETVLATLSEIRVTFDRRMADERWSWVAESPETFPEIVGAPRRLEDGRTFVLPVRLEPERGYVVRINSERFKNFTDEQGRPAEPARFTFRTAPAPPH